MILTALDPGGHTGWSMWRFDAITPLTHISHGTTANGLRGFLDFNSEAQFLDVDVVVIEGFELDGRTPKPDLTPRDIIGAVTALMYPLSPIVQPNSAKFFADNKTLMRIGLYWKGLGHDRDSARHALAYMRKIRHMPTLRAFYPEPD